MILSVRRYQRASLWFSIAIALCALRGANRFSVILAFLSVIFRIIQVCGIVTQKEGLAKFAYGVATFFIVLLFFIDFANESADQVHERMPTKAQMKDMYELMMATYKGRVPPPDKKLI